jgi:hypothetical protein
MGRKSRTEVNGIVFGWLHRARMPPGGSKTRNRYPPPLEEEQTLDPESADEGFADDEDWGADT